MTLSMPGQARTESEGLFAGRYRVEHELGRGGMGVVFRALDLEQDRTVAIKLLLGGHEGAEEVSRRFRREFRAVQRLSHPNIVAVYDYGIADGQTYFTMECVEGQNLRRTLGLSPRPEDPSVLNAPERLRLLLDLFVQLVRALTVVHEHRILHRDLKPSNLLVTPGGQIKVMDFGLVRTLDEEASRLTQEGVVVGTVAYMSPEQALGGRMDFRSDLYSAGVLLYEALAGRRPFEDPTFTGLLLKQLHERPYPISVYNPGVPAALEAIALRLLEKDPFDRYQSSEELLGALEAATLESAEEDSGRPLAAGAAGGSGGQQLLPPRFVGRENEMQLLLGRVHELAAGNGSLVLVGGESGIGKSRLLEEVRGLGRLAQVQFFRGKCSEGSIAPYSAFLGPMERICEGLGRRDLDEQRALLGREGRALTHISPKFLELDAVAELPPLESLSPAQERYRVFSAVTTLLRQLACGRPIALILEDLQWADALSVDLLGHLVRNLVYPGQELDAPDLAAPVLLLGTYRDDEIQEHPLKSLIAQLRRRRQVTSIQLARLDLEQVARFLQSMLAMDEPPRHLAQRIFQESEGNPFFVEEIMKSLLEEGVLRRQAEGWILDYDVSADAATLETGSFYAHLRIPASIQDVVNKRLERLGPDDLKILACAAVIGREFSFDLLLEVAEVDEDTLLDAIDSFLKHQVIVERSGAQDSFDFYHAKIREVLYARLRQRELTRYHRRTALATERLHADQLERHYDFLAHHCFAAGLQDKAIEYLYRAGRRFQEQYLNEEAIGHLRQALSALDAKTEQLSPEQSLTRLSCLNALGQVLLHVGQSSAAEEAFSRMEGLAQEEGIEVQLAWALLGLGQCAQRFGNYRRATELVSTAQQIFLRHQEVLGSAFCHRNLAQVETIQRRFSEAGTHYRQALALFETLGEGQYLAAILGDSGINDHEQRKLDEAVAAYRRSLELYRHLGDKGGMARILINLGVTDLEQGHYRSAIECYREAIRLNQEVGNKSNLAACYQNQGLLFLGLGHYAEALEACTRAVQLSEELGQRYYLCQALHNQGEVLLALGQDTAAREHFERALEIAREIEVPSHAAFALLKLGRLAQQHGATAEAIELYRQARKDSEREADDEAWIRASLRLLLLKQDSGGPQARELLERARRTGSHEYQIDVCLDAALILARSGELQASETLAVEALDKARQSGFLDDQIAALSLRSSLAEQHGEFELAAEHYAGALSALEEVLDHVPEAYRESFLGRPDIAACLDSARRVGAQSGLASLRSVLAAFDPVPRLDEEVTTSTVRGSLSSAEPLSEDSESTGLIDYGKLGLPGQRPRSS